MDQEQLLEQPLREDLIPYVRRRMQQRVISEEAIDWVLVNYDTRRPAEPRPGAEPAEILIAEYQGRRLKVYLRTGAVPFFVKTVVWEGDE